MPSNEPKNAKIELTVKVDYVPVFEIERMLLRLELRAGQITNLRVRIRRAEEEPLDLAKIETQW